MDSVTHYYGSSTTTNTSINSTKETSYKNLRSTSGTVTFTAQWTAITYTLSYTLNSGNHGSSHPTSATYDSEFTVNNPTKSNYTFAGWNITGMDSVTHTYGSNTTTATSLSGIKVTKFKNLTSVKDATVAFVAKWCRNCAGTTNGSCELTTASGTTCTYTTSCNTGYTISNDGAYNATCSANTYEVTLNKGSGTSAGTTKVTATYNSATINPSTITLASKSYTISGFDLASSRNSNGATVSSTNTITSTATLNGYYTASSGGSKVLDASTTATWIASISGYTDANKKWIKAGTAMLYAQFGSMAEKTLPTITKTGYTCGWTTSSTGTTITYASGGKLTPSANTTLYGVCIIQKAISFTYTGAMDVTIGNSTTSYSANSSGTPISVSGQDWEVIFKSNGSLNVTAIYGNVDIHAVGGGGGGGSNQRCNYYGGGGGGGYTQYLNNQSLATGTYSIEIGAGGEGGGQNSHNNGNKGGTSKFGNLLSAEGGEGGGQGTRWTSGVGGNGGSGGGSGNAGKATAPYTNHCSSCCTCTTTSGIVSCNCSKSCNSGNTCKWSMTYKSGASCVLNGQGGVDGSAGIAGMKNNSYQNAAVGTTGTGQGTTTKDYGSSTGTLRAGGGSGGDRYCQVPQASGGGGLAGTCKSNSANGGNGEDYYGGGGGGAAHCGDNGADPCTTRFKGGNGGKGVVMFRSHR
jgi:hypothetical protein